MTAHDVRRIVQTLRVPKVIFNTEKCLQVFLVNQKRIYFLYRGSGLKLLLKSPTSPHRKDLSVRLSYHSGAFVLTSSEPETDGIFDGRACIQEVSQGGLQEKPVLTLYLFIFFIRRALNRCGRAKSTSRRSSTSGSVRFNWLSTFRFG